MSQAQTLLSSSQVKPTFYSKSAPRTVFTSHDCEVTAYPSTGGIILGYFTSAELSYFNLSRSEAASRSPDPFEEDVFALKLLQIGGRWWPSRKFYSKHSDRMSEIPYGHHFPPTIHIGYLETGGIWILRTADDRVRLPSDPEEKPKDWGKLVMAFTMGERCAVLERYRATFY